MLLGRSVGRSRGSQRRGQRSGSVWQALTNHGSAVLIIQKHWIVEDLSNSVEIQRVLSRLEPCSVVSSVDGIRGGKWILLLCQVAQRIAVGEIEERGLLLRSGWTRRVIIRIGALLAFFALKGFHYICVGTAFMGLVVFGVFQKYLNRGPSKEGIRTVFLLYPCQWMHTERGDWNC